MTGLTGTYTPPAGMNGTELVTFVVENGCHHTDVGQLTIDVNHTPVGGNLSRNMSAGDPLTLDVSVSELASDDEALTITGLGSTAPPWASFDATTVTVGAAARDPKRRLYLHRHGPRPRRADGGRDDHHHDQRHPTDRSARPIRDARLVVHIRSDGERHRRRARSTVRAGDPGGQPS